MRASLHAVTEPLTVSVVEGLPSKHLVITERTVFGHTSITLSAADARRIATALLAAAGADPLEYEEPVKVAVG